jgi:uncharacterized protein with HEPN domain
MRRDTRVLLMTVVESADAIADAVEGISFRNKLAHEYDMVDDVLVWGVIQKSLPPLRAICSDLIDNLPQKES